MIRMDRYKITVTRRHTLSVGDEPDHYLILTELDGKPINHKAGIAGEFVSRRSVGYHNSRRGSGPMEGFAVEIFQEGTIFSYFKGMRDGVEKTTEGTWEYYKGTGKLTTIRGDGTFKVTSAEKAGEYMLTVEGEYALLAVDIEE
jgi:hypothetical protein